MPHTFLPRILEETIRKALKTFPVTLVTGPRQSGKTTLLKERFSDAYRYISLDQPDVRERAQVDPVGFLRDNPPPVIIDEIQYVPHLLDYIKAAVDRDRRPGSWILTGSHNLSLMQGISETLAGRIAVLTLLPLSFAEACGLGSQSCSVDTLLQGIIRSKAGAGNTSPPDVADIILRGYYPEIRANRHVDRHLWCSGFIQTYLERDVRQIVNVGDLTLFNRFLRLCAARTGTILNMSEFSRSLGVSSPTIRRWLSILEASYQVFLLPPYHNNLGKRIVKSPKLYFLDTALATYLIGLHQREPLVHGPVMGNLFETMIVAEWIKYFLHRGERPQLFYWRSKSGLEIDLIIERDLEIWCIEVKSTATVRLGHTVSLTRWRDMVSDEKVHSLLIADCPESFSIKNVQVLPWFLSPELTC